MAAIATQEMPGFAFAPTGLVRRIRPPQLIGDTRAADAVPRVRSFLPPAGSIIQAASALQFDVIDDHTVVRYWIAAYYAGHQDVREVVHDGDGFGPAFSSSTRTALFEWGRPVGSRFVIRRNGDWPAAPRLHIEAVDDGGNVSVLA